MGNVVDLTAKKIPDSIGNKALGLRRLQAAGFGIPRSWVVTWEAYQRYLRNDLSLIPELQKELSGIVEAEKAYAVRSSASVEDSLEQSYAGQFKSVLDVRGVDAVIQAIWSIWATASSSAVTTYLERRNQSNVDFKMAVIVQEMAPTQFAGVAFSRNPMTGADEIIIETVPGRGDRLVQDGVTPLQWTHKWGSWIVRPGEAQQSEPAAAAVVEGVKKIAAAMASNVDLEWAFHDGEVTWLQMREITSLKNLNVYSNRISRDMLPGMIKPLIWSINIPLVNSAWIRVLEEAVGRTNLKPDDLAHAFYYRAYFNMSALGKVFNQLGFPSEGLEMMVGSAPKDQSRPVFKFRPKMALLAPRMLVFSVHKWIFGAKMKRAMPKLHARISSISKELLHTLTDAQVWERIAALEAELRETAYYNIVGPLLMSMYNQMLKRQLRKLDVDYESFDLTADFPEINAYAPDSFLRSLRAKYSALSVEAKERIAAGGMAELELLPEAQSLRTGLEDFMQRFGHLSDSGNDFSFPPWRETPGLVLGMVVNYPDHTDTRNTRIKFNDLPKKKRPGLFYRRAREFRLLREQISSLYTYGYGLFRVFYLELGRRLVDRDRLDAPEDIFYLTRQQVAEALQSGDSAHWREIVAGHKQEMERVRDFNLPQVIYGEQPPPAGQLEGEQLTGMPTSRGYYAGCVRVVQGLGDFAKVQPGDVLVVPYSDVGWTPLFARAGAVVAESGGMLSHASIVAREYNIPAVVSVSGAMRLRDGMHIAVDGYRGIVTVVAD
ncbi:MAG: hypothetical protein HY835_05275 [Anaerolineae bacterium]|nr:hypothetical protein [Anaerolineae bacterium]